MKSAVQEGQKSATSVTIEEAWSETTRELQVRERCFDKWVADGKLAWADAKDRVARLNMAAVILSVIADEPVLAEKLIKLAIEKIADETTAADA